MDLLLEKKRVAWLSVISNTLLTVAKFVVGVMTGSVSILSEAAHSAIDLLAAGIATFSVHVADRPPDKNHQYGHEKVENVSGVIEGILIFIAAAWIIYESVDRLLHRMDLQYLSIGWIVMAVSAAINLAVATLLKRSAIQNGSVALEADAAHLYADVYSSVGVFLGLFCIAMGKRFFGFNLTWLDPLVAIGVALLILWTATRITKKSFLPLVDTSASEEEILPIKRVMDEFGNLGIDFHKLRTRRAGGTLHVDLHMGFRPGVSLESGHKISHELKSRIEASVPSAKVLVHVEPSNSMEVLSDTDEKVMCMRAELLKDHRVCEVRDFKATCFRGDLRIEAELCLDPNVTIAEGRVLTDELKDRLESCFTDVKETVLSLRPASGWQKAIHEDDMERIRDLVGEHQSRLAGIHELEVSSSGGSHRIRLYLGVPPGLPVAEAHNMARHIEADIRKLFPEDPQIDLHIEPCKETCETCRAICSSKESSYKLKRL